MKIKTSELQGAALNWAVDVSLNKECEGYAEHEYAYDWAHGGPIIEREGISVVYDVELSQAEGREYYATVFAVPAEYGRIYGPTPLIAAMRCQVAANLGDEVDVPDYLVGAADETI